MLSQDGLGCSWTNARRNNHLGDAHSGAGFDDRTRWDALVLAATQDCGPILAAHNGSFFVKPVLQSLLLADKIYEDKATGKKVVAGIFNRLLLVPGSQMQRTKDDAGNESIRVLGGTDPGCPSAYFSITDFQGTAPFLLRYVDLSDSKVLLQAVMQISCKNPLETIEVVLPMPVLPKPHKGIYALELLCENEPLGSVRIVVDEADSGTSS